MRSARIVLATAAALGLTALAAWHFEWSFEKAALLAPVIVLAVGAAAFLVVLWAKIVWESVRGRGDASRSPADTRPDTGERRA